jgi:hypothetical protein
MDTRFWKVTSTVAIFLFLPFLAWAVIVTGFWSLTLQDHAVIKRELRACEARNARLVAEIEDCDQAPVPDSYVPKLHLQMRELNEELKKFEGRILPPFTPSTPATPPSME